MAALEAGWQDAVSGLEEMGIAIEALLKSILASADISAEVSKRVKSRESADGKIDRHPEKYNAYVDLQDLLGLRITTYFSDDVDRVASLFEQEFKIDAANSVDKRKLLDPDRFGYLSLHYISELSDQRVGLTEYRKFEGRCFELQIRSVLQHAWAEIEHDLGYKVQAAVPPPVRRRFSRLAGLLEIADDEFVSLRDELSAYEAETTDAVDRADSDLDTDQSTVTALVEADSDVSRLDADIAALWPISVASEVNQRYLGARVAELRALGLVLLPQVRQSLHSEADNIRKFAAKWVETPDHRERPLQRGVSLFYLVLLLVSRAEVDQLADEPALAPYLHVIDRLHAATER